MQSLGEILGAALSEPKKEDKPSYSYKEGDVRQMHCTALNRCEKCDVCVPKNLRN